MTTNRDEIEAWVREAAPGLAESGFAQVDIDELFDPPPAKAVASGLDAVQRMREVLRELDRADDVMMVIPLPYSFGLERDHPDLADLVANDWEYGPGREVPGFYLLRIELWRAYEDCEDYRRAIVTDLLPPDFKAYYRTRRTLDEEARGWEYSRQINIRTV